MKSIQKIITGLIIMSITLLISLLAYSLGLLSSTQANLSNKLFESNHQISDDIVIVGIDAATLTSIEEGGLGNTGDWSRSYYSNVIETLDNAGADIIMLDILFNSEDKGITEVDLALNYFLDQDPSSFTKTILSYLETPHPNDSSLIESLNQINDLYLIKSPTGNVELINNQLVYSGETQLMLDLEDHVNTGYANIYGSDLSSNSSEITGIPLSQSVNGIESEHITLQIARNYLNWESGLGYSEDRKSYELFKGSEVPIENGMMLINYKSAPYEWNSISFKDVFYREFNPEDVEGKIVLIAPYSKASQDFFFTPIDSTNPMMGIEIHANAIQTLLDQEFLEQQDTMAFIGLVTMIALISVFAFLYLPIWAGLIVLLVEIAAFPFYAQWRFDKGVIINLIWPVFAMVAAYLLVMAYRNVTEFREKRKLRNAFSHYVSPELVNQISTSGDDLALGGERRYMTTLFLDIENFTSLSEKLEPHDVVTIINKYFDAFAKEIMSHGGTVDKFEGDAIMALFGAPLKSEDHALKACQTAMAIRSKVEELNQETNHNLNVRVGVATGDCIVGNMGSEQRFDYTAMGDTVNTASRLEGGNKFYGTRILVNAGTMEGAHEHIFFRRIDRVRLKGKADAIDIYEVMGSNEAVSEAGKLLVNEWHTALEYYRNQDWSSVEIKLRAILEKLPDDGPTLTYLERVEKLKTNPPEGWDGTWTFNSK